MNEWKLYGLGKSTHPLHLHVHHMQIISATCVAGSANCDQALLDAWVSPGEWRDVFPTFEAELTVRFRATDFPGETVLHCHFLRHEDLGMMDTVLVTACAGDSCNACWSNSELCNEDGRVDSLLTLPTVKSS